MKKFTLTQINKIQIKNVREALICIILLSSFGEKALHDLFYCHQVQNAKVIDFI